MEAENGKAELLEKLATIWKFEESSEIVEEVATASCELALLTAMSMTDPSEIFAMMLSDTLSITASPEEPPHTRRLSKTPMARAELVANRFSNEKEGITEMLNTSTLVEAATKAKVSSSDSETSRAADCALSREIGNDAISSGFALSEMFSASSPLLFAARNITLLSLFTAIPLIESGAEYRERTEMLVRIVASRMVS